MSFLNFNSQMRQVFIGNFLLVICALLYLVWWLVTFKPGVIAGNISTYIIIGAAAIGVIALIFLVGGIQNSAEGYVIVPNRNIIFAGVALYFILLVITDFVLKRKVTSELLLIIGWAALELCVINVLYGANVYSMMKGLIVSIVVGVAAMISLVCYVLYYRLTGTASYIDGMVPLILVAFVTAGINLGMIL